MVVIYPIGIKMIRISCLDEADNSHDHHVDQLLSASSTGTGFPPLEVLTSNYLKAPKLMNFNSERLLP